MVLENWEPWASSHAHWALSTELCTPSKPEYQIRRNYFITLNLLNSIRQWSYTLYMLTAMYTPTTFHTHRIPNCVYHLVAINVQNRINQQNLWVHMSFLLFSGLIVLHGGAWTSWRHPKMANFQVKGRQLRRVINKNSAEVQWHLNWPRIGTQIGVAMRLQYL